MKRTQLFGATLAVALLAGTGLELRATRSAANVVIEWNQIVQDTIPGAGWRPRPALLLDDAHRDVRCDQRHRARVRRPTTSACATRGGGSPEAAAAQAAHDVLVGLNPPATAVYDAALARQLGAKPSGFERRGAAIGARVAKEVLAWRQNDGWIVDRPPAVRRTAPAGALAADAAEQPDRGLHPPPERCARWPS